MFGRLEPYKGAHVALRAFATVAGQVDATLELVGAGSQERLLRELARELGLRDRVNFAGPVSQEEALRRIAEFDVILVPSLTTRAWKEQFGRVAAQAMAAGTSVIASDSGALPEVLGGCGELVPEGSVSDLATALQSLLHDDARRARLGALSRRRAQTHLSWERVAAGCDDMYAQLLGATNPSRIISGPPASCGPFAPR
jgi:glycosyltransferase involved in cell wall biosynthesis